MKIINEEGLVYNLYNDQIEKEKRDKMKYPLKESSSKTYTCLIGYESINQAIDEVEKIKDCITPLAYKTIMFSLNNRQPKETIIKRCFDTESNATSPPIEETYCLCPGCKSRVKGYDCICKNCGQRLITRQIKEVNIKNIKERFY